MRSFVIFISTVLLAVTGFSGVVNQVGSYTNWASTWTAINGGNDSSNAVNQTLDFVGNSSSPGLYYANNGSYAMFRMRVNADTFTTASGAHILLIDVANYGVTGIDYFDPVFVRAVLVRKGGVVGAHHLVQAKQRPGMRGQRDSQ